MSGALAIPAMPSPGWYAMLRCMVRFRAFFSPRAELTLGETLTLGARTSISAFSQVSTADGAVRIGSRTDIATGCCINGHPGGVVIGDDCLISAGVVIGAASHDDQPAPPRPTRLGRNVWLGTGVVVLRGVEIADGVIVAPNSVVAADVPANAILQGNPGKVIFTRR